MNEQTSAQGGFSLVEIVAAMMILSFGLLAMAASTGYVSAQLRSTAFDSQRNFARQQVVEQLRGTYFDQIATNTAGLSVGRFTVSWVVTSPVSPVRRVSVITTGPAYKGSGGSRVVVSDTAMVEIVSPR